MAAPRRAAATSPTVRFNTQPPEGGCWRLFSCCSTQARFQHTATRRWLHTFPAGWPFARRFNTQPPEGGCIRAASAQRHARSFNTQPPEGGCAKSGFDAGAPPGFNTQPPEGGCQKEIKKCTPKNLVSTHSHPKVAARPDTTGRRRFVVSTHSHPKVAAQL